MAVELAREIPGATLTWLDELGHYPMIEDASRWATAVNAWLARQGREAAPTGE